MDKFTRSSKQEFLIYRGEGADIVDSKVKLASLWGSSRVKLLQNLDVSKIDFGLLSSECEGSQISRHWQNLFKNLFTVYSEISSPE